MRVGGHFATRSTRVQAKYPDFPQPRHLPSGGLQAPVQGHYLKYGTIGYSLFAAKEWTPTNLSVNSASQFLTNLRAMSENILNVTDDSFESDVLRNEHPVLVDYWAEWCGPCKMIAPVLEEVADEYAGKMVVAKLNIDDNPNTPPKYGIRGIPTLMIFKGGEVAATKVGALSKSQLLEFIQSNS